MVGRPEARRKAARCSPRRNVRREGTRMPGAAGARPSNCKAMTGIEEAIIKVYLLQRDSLRERAEAMLEQAPDRDVPPTWVVPMDVPAVDKLVGRTKPYLYYDRQRRRFTHIVH